jgi:hypothetical protein
MCTVNPADGEALVCDVALPRVHALLAEDPAVVVREESVPGSGTRVRLVRGDPEAFDTRVRAAITEVNR